MDNQFTYKEDVDEYKEIQGEKEISNNNESDMCSFKVEKNKSFNISYSILADYITREELPTSNSKENPSKMDSLNKFSKTSHNKIQNKFKVNPKLTHSGSTNFNNYK